MKKILFFSNNLNKIKEIKSLFKELDIKVLTPKDFNLFNEPNENGSSFAENAKIKSSFGYENIKLPCFADDSGICIEALEWKPNIFSRRYIDSFESHNACFKNIIKEVKNTKKIKAYFKTSICLTLNVNYHIVFEGQINGRISLKKLGKNGFGYDPIFIPEGYVKTFAEMNNKEKNLISHRNIAIRKLSNFLSN